MSAKKTGWSCKRPCKRNLGARQIHENQKPPNSRNQNRQIEEPLSESSRPHLNNRLSFPLPQPTTTSNNMRYAILESQSFFFRSTQQFTLVQEAINCAEIRMKNRILHSFSPSVLDKLWRLNFAS